MHPGIEHLVFVAYLDSLFVENRTREVTPTREIPETMNRLLLQAMRDHARERALLHWEEGEWRPTPDWRLDRHVIRLALYLRERAGVEPGDSIALVSELRPEWLVADLAALGLGAVSAVIDPGLRGAELRTALEDAAPRVTFVSPAVQATLERDDGRAPAFGQLVPLASWPGHTGAPTLEAWLELGGTLDTPERAQAFRASSREVEPGRPAMRHYVASPAGWQRLELTQGEIVERLRAVPPEERGRPGDLAWVIDPAVSPAARLALYAFLGDGYTTTALAPASSGLGEAAALRPSIVVAPPAIAAEVAHGAHERLGLRARLRRGRAIHELLGGRIRRLGLTGPIEPALLQRLDAGIQVGPIPT
jgi:long-chain acyl-CoA synthetase